MNEIMTSIDLSAPVIARHAVVVGAAVDTVWRLHRDIDRWPDWQNDIVKAHLTGPFAAGSSFTWKTHGLSIVSEIYQVEDSGTGPRRTLWGGPAQGIVGLHLWTFTATPYGTHVATEESWSGSPVEADIAGMQTSLDASLVAWMAHLKAAAERSSFDG